MKLKRIMAIALAAVMVAASGVGLTQATFANDRIVVILDGNFVHFPDAEPQIINDRVMVPVRPIGYALGADVNWDPATSTVLLTRDSRYATLTVGAETMLFGSFVRDAEGTMEATSAEAYHLDSPPVIVEERALFPARAVAYAFDVYNVDWLPDMRAVVITSESPNAPPEPTPEPTPTPPPQPTPPPVAQQVFPNSDFYNERSAGWIQDIHTGGRTRFAVVVFDGNDSGSHAAVQRVIDASTRAEFPRLMGFDVSGGFPNPERLTWVWEEATRSEMPFVIFSFAGQEDYVVTNLSDSEALYEMFTNIGSNNPRLPSARPTPTPSPSPSPSPSPGASPSPSPGTTSNIDQQAFSWNAIQLAQTQAMFDRDEAFAIFIYHSNDSNLSGVRDMVREVAQQEQVPVFHAVAGSHVDWVERTVGFDNVDRTPMLIIVINRQDTQFFLGLNEGRRSEVSQALWSFKRR